MFCPSCGAQNDQPNQRYCQECGTTLPATGGMAIAHRPMGDILPPPRRRKQGVLSMLPEGLGPRIAIGAVAAVVGIIVLYAVVSFLVSLVIHVVLPIMVVLGLAYAGFLFIRHKVRS